MSRTESSGVDSRVRSVTVKEIREEGVGGTEIGEYVFKECKKKRESKKRKGKKTG